MWSRLKKVLGTLAAAGAKSAVDGLPDVAVSSPSLVVALHRLGAKVGADVLAEALRRLAAAGVADLANGRAAADSPLMVPFHLAMAQSGSGQDREAARHELRRRLVDLETPTEAWAGLLHVIDGSDVADVGESLHRSVSPLQEDSEAVALVNDAIAAAVAEVGEPAFLPLKTAVSASKTASKFAQPVARTVPATKAVKKSASPTKKAASKSAKKQK